MAETFMPSSDRQTDNLVLDTEFPVRESIRTFDWANTSLGPADVWPGHLKCAVNLMLLASTPSAVFWGREAVALYNDAYMRAFGEGRPGGFGRSLRESRPDLWLRLEPSLSSAFTDRALLSRNDLAFQIIQNGAPKDAYFDLSCCPITDHAGAVAGAFCMFTDTTERVATRKKLARSEERLSAALNASGVVGTFDWIPQDDILYYDRRFAAFFSLDPERGNKGATISEYLARIHPDDVDLLKKAVARSLETGEPFIQEYRVTGDGGFHRWLLERNECVEFHDGKPTRFPGVVIDVTERKEAQERGRLLLREMNHRLKNLFAVVGGLVGFTARSARSPAEMAEILRERLNALSRANDLIMPGTEHAPGTQTSLEALVKTIIRPYGDDSGGRQRIEFDGTLVMAGPHAVTALALALHECATNAAKYGALSTPDGSIRIQWSILRSELHLTWCEFGGPEITAPPNDQGFGSILTQRSIAQLGGKIKHDWHKTGLKAKIEVPLDRLAN